MRSPADVLAECKSGQTFVAHHSRSIRSERNAMMPAIPSKIHKRVATIFISQKSALKGCVAAKVFLSGAANSLPNSLPRQLPPQPYHVTPSAHYRPLLCFILSQASSSLSTATSTAPVTGASTPTPASACSSHLSRTPTAAMRPQAAIFPAMSVSVSAASLRLSSPPVSNSL